MSKLKLQATDGSAGTVSLKAPASTTGNAEFELTLPGNAGSNGQLLSTNGSGVLSWSDDNSGVSLSGSTNNTIATVSGANALVGEANLTYDGTDLKLTTDANGEGIVMYSSGSTFSKLSGDANRASENQSCLYIQANWNGTAVGAIDFVAGPDTTNKDDGHIKFQTATSGSTITERMRIDSEGRIDLGGQTNSSTGIGVLRTKHHTTSNNPVNVIGCVSGSGYNNVQIGGNDTSFAGTASTAVRFYTAANATTANGTYRGQWDGSGNLSIDDGNLIVASGHGIDFSAHANDGGMTSELFDDYEEGGFTPGSTNADFSTKTGWYTKVGRLVHVQLKVEGGSNFNGSNAVYITGLPYTNAASKDVVGSALYYKISFASGYTDLVAPYIAGGGTSIYFMRMNSGSGSGNYLLADAFHTNASIDVNITYFAAT